MTHPLRQHIATAKPAIMRYQRTFLAATAVSAVAALAVRTLTRRAERMNPPVGRFIEVDGVRLHYVEHGEGQPVVFLHGNGVMLQDLQLSGVLDLAAREYRVIAFDRPGYGYSARPRGRTWNPLTQAKLLRAALDALGAQNPIIVGHSWGTQIALAMGLEFPDYPRALVLLSGYYFPTVRLDVALLSPPAIPVLGDAMRYTVSPLLTRLMWPLLLRRLFAPGPVPAHFAAFPTSMALRPSQLRAAAAEAALLIPAAAGLQKRYQEMRVPTVIVAGAEDRYVSTEHHSVRLHQILPHSELLTVPGASHMIHHDAPENVIAAIQTAQRLALVQPQPASAANAAAEAPATVGKDPSAIAKTWTGH